MLLLNRSVLQKTVLSLDVFVLQLPMLLLNRSVLQKTVLPLDVFVSCLCCC